MSTGFDFNQPPFSVSRNEHGAPEAVLTADQEVMSQFACEALHDELAREPHNPWLHLWYGLGLWKQELFEEAEAEIAQGERLGASTWRCDWFRALLIRDDIKHWSGVRYEQARKLVRNVLQLKPGFRAAEVFRLYLWGYYSQWGQDVLAEDFFILNPPTARRFLDVGAFDGVNLSNSRRFFDCEWTGVCVEPVGENFQKLEDHYQSPGIMCVKRAIADTAGYCDITIQGTGAHLLSGDRQENCRKERVQTSPLSALMAELKVTGVDLLSIDVEGFDYQALASFDFQICRPRLIVIEHNCMPEVIEPVTACMKNQAYVLWHDNRQDFFFYPSELTAPPDFWKCKSLLPSRQKVQSAVAFGPQGPLNIISERFLRALQATVLYGQHERAVYLIDEYAGIDCPFTPLQALRAELLKTLP